MMREIEEILRREMGMQASSVGSATVEGVVRGRMARVGVATTEDYLRTLRESPGELTELTEAVVVHESWFFRDGTPFTALMRWTREQWQPAHPVGTLRVLTIPCSTGEEPYSVAMALLDAGLPPERFTVDGVDISRPAVERARQAVYGSNSFRGTSLGFRDRYFTPVPEGHSLSDSVRKQVRFATGNLLAADFRPGVGRFDVIFCRNLLIYFDRPTQAQAMTVLGRLLAPDGLLFVGHAETQVATTAGFVLANFPRAFAFRPAPAAAATPPPVRTPRLTAPLRATTILAPTPRQPLTTRAAPPAPVAPLKPKPKPAGLDAARALADQGKLDEATRLCEERLRTDNADAAAWFLLGVVRDAAGDRPRAATCYAKALYLEPGHQEALLASALLAEQTGDTATAAQMRRRIARVTQHIPRP